MLNKVNVRWGERVEKMGVSKIKIKVNEKWYEIEVNAGETLLDLLREKLYLTGTKRGCEIGECGACSVILNTEPVNSCLVLAPSCDGAEVLTVEGLSKNGELHPLQRAFLDTGAVQCGYCTPGMLMSAYALVKKNSKPSRRDAKIAISGNLCRCTGYQQIVDAILLAAKRMRRKK